MNDDLNLLRGHVEQPTRLDDFEPRIRLAQPIERKAHALSDFQRNAALLGFNGFVDSVAPRITDLALLGRAFASLLNRRGDAATLRGALAHPAEGAFHAMVANDGPHYGDNVKLLGPGKYQLTFTLLPPGGHGSLGTKQGDYVMAFKLPD